ncbi:hypothetical protein BJ878DRAFT_327561 [Calycina marina]|uniref:Uncharacterized protein n=1 Tax=Calycina marina TaxID=1763456 RepID=A0A9P7ZAU6_9HELO|nr:hypothetical protein BJ878DRAFT_327561 [Calycina marina]
MPDSDSETPVVSPFLCLQLSDSQLEKRDFTTQQAEFASITDFALHQCHFFDQKSRLPVENLSPEALPLEVFGSESLKGTGLRDFIDCNLDHGPCVLTHLARPDCRQGLPDPRRHRLVSMPALPADIPLTIALGHQNCFPKTYYREYSPVLERCASGRSQQFFERDVKIGVRTLDMQQKMGDLEQSTRYLDNNLMSC